MREAANGERVTGGRTDADVCLDGGVGGFVLALDFDCFLLFLLVVVWLLSLWALDTSEKLSELAVVAYKGGREMWYIATPWVNPTARSGRGERGDVGGSHWRDVQSGDVLDFVERGEYFISLVLSSPSSTQSKKSPSSTPSNPPSNTQYFFKPSPMRLVLTALS
jgi:hypothetical protein